MMERATISWPISFPATEISTRRSSAQRRSVEPQLQPKDATFSMECPAHESLGSGARRSLMESQLQQEKVSFSAGMEPQWQPKEAAFSVSSQLDKGTRSMVHESSQEFGQMIREKLQEFAMILSKEYHYNFPTEYFEDYHGSFNKEDFLKMKQPKEKARSRGADSLPNSKMEWKKCTDSSRIIKEECTIGDDIGGEWHYPKGICDEEINRAAKAKEQSEMVEREVHLEGNSSKHKEGGAVDVEEKDVESELQQNSNEWDEDVAEFQTRAVGLIAEESLESLEEIEAQTIGKPSPNGDDSLLGVTDGVDYVPQTKELDFFGSIGELDLGKDSFLYCHFGGSINLVYGEHPHGEQPSQTLFIRNIDNNVEGSKLRSAIQALRFEFEAIEVNLAATIEVLVQVVLITILGILRTKKKKPRRIKRKKDIEQKMKVGIG